MNQNCLIIREREKERRREKGGREKSALVINYFLLAFKIVVLLLREGYGQCDQISPHFGYFLRGYLVLGKLWTRFHLTLGIFKVFGYFLKVYLVIL